MKVLLIVNLNDEEKEESLKLLDESAEVQFHSELTEEEKEEAISVADIIVGGRLTDEQLESAKNLKMQQIFGTGVNRHNLEFFKENNIAFCNSHAHSYIIAEHGFSLLVAVSKNLLSSDQKLREGDWDPQRGSSVSLLNKTLLFVGYGVIAQHFQTFCEVFNMKYLAIKRTKDTDVSSVKIFLPDEKKEAFKQADFIFNSLPLTEKTTDFIDESDFEVMKPEAIIVNVGRGETINDKALFDALKAKKIKGAGIDVWYNYPTNRGGEQEPSPCYPSDYPFQELDNIIMSAHRAWVTDLSFFEFRKKLLENVNRFIRREELENIVDLDEGY